MSDTVTVHCGVANGLHLRLFEMRPEPDTQVKRAFRVGDPVVLNKGRNEVDRDFMTAWLKQNADNDLVTGGHVRLINNGDS